jgi:ribonucleoside-diphosphate reductase alpha chain
MAPKKQNTPPKQGLKIERYYTQANSSVYDGFEYEYRSSIIRNPTGNTVFEMNNVEVPKTWSQVATDILAQKYFRKAGVPLTDGTTGSENSAKQVIHRLAHCWRTWGERYGYFATPNDAQAFYDEVAFMLLDQMAAPNSPQWFNTGLYETYGITGPAQGHYFVDPVSEELTKSGSAYERPQVHACFILSVKDDLVNEGGIMDLWIREARIFKYGSGVGTNFSTIRGESEPLSGGGYSSGLMSFLKIGDRAAGAIKSGGTTRRAAKMVIVDVDHPEIMSFIKWKAEEERKVAALIAAGYSSDYEGEAYRTVSGQNSNNSVRITNRFLEAVDQDQEWHTAERSRAKSSGTYRAREMWEEIAKCAWACADPGLQYHDTINEWHTCPEDGPIRASNPCSEYMFLDDTACNLASLNLRKFLNSESLEFDVNGYTHACRLWTIVLEISVLMAQFPSKEIAQLSYEFRTLGLGFANLGSLLMVCGIAYDSAKGHAIAGALSAIMTGTSYATSAEMAAFLGAFKGYERNKEHMLRVIRNHRFAAYNAPDYEQLSVKPMGIDQAECPNYLLKAAGSAWDKALQLGMEHGYRNAQSTVIAPTGTIGLLMDCDTTGVEPDFSLVKFKKLAGGGYFKIINQSIPLCLKNLGYPESEIEAIVNYVKGHASLVGCPHLNADSLRAKGFNARDIEVIENSLLSAFDVNFVFNIYNLGEETLQRIGLTPEQYQHPDFNLLESIGYTDAQIEAANEYICGTMTIEGAPFLKVSHYPIFDCANKCGVKGTRYIQPKGHIMMMAAVQPFISGAISKTINLPHEATWQEIELCHRQAWQLSLKAISIYRDGSKLSQPLSSKSDKKKTAETTTTASAENATATTSPAVVELNSEQLLETVRQLLANSSADNPFLTELRQMVNRRPLPSKRKGWTQKNKVGGQTIFLRTGEYEDGSLGEIFIDMHKEGATLRSMLNCFAISVSIGLQYGVPLTEFVDKFAFTRFEPSGMVDHPNLRSATSMLDYIFRLLAFEYLQREDLVQVSAEQAAAESTKVMENSATVRVQTPQAELVIKPQQPTAPANGVSNGSSKSYTNGNAAKAMSANVEPTQVLLSSLMGDAPACNVCGHITIRNGTCYKCLNCGNSMGCS